MSPLSLTAAGALDGTILPPIGTVLRHHGVGETHSKRPRNTIRRRSRTMHLADRGVLVPMIKTTTVPGAEHYREIAGMLRGTAGSCQFAGARKEILHLAERFESCADHLDRRAGSTTQRA